MLLDSRTTRLLLEAAEDAGIPRRRLLDAALVDEREVTAPEVRVEWRTVVRLVNAVSREVDDDPERLRDIGRRMSRSPVYEPLRRVAGSIVSVRSLYDITSRWVVPAFFPHLRLVSQFAGERRLLFHGEIPEPYEPCLAFIHIFEGSVTQLPTLIRLQPARLLESRVTPRSAYIVVELPLGHSIGQRVRRGVRALLGTRATLAVLEEQREQLADSIAALERARDELRGLLERLPDLVIVHANGRILWTNRAFATTLGYPADAIVGTSLLDIVAPRTRALVVERMGLPADAPGIPALTEGVLLTRSGEEVIIEVAPAEAVVFEGEKARLLVGRDVTERVRMQQKLMVADRLASIGLLAAGVAHEVNNPLAYVLNNIEIARNELAPLGAEAEISLHVLSVALEGVDRIRAIVRDLLLLARGDRGPLVTLDLQTVADSMLALAAREIERTTVLVREYAPAPPVEATDARIAQILLNLVANALEAMQGQSREDNRLVVRIGRTSDGSALLEVSDTGRGIPDEHLPRLFEPFFTTKPAGQGTGLGLPIAHRLVVELGGEITVTSERGRGTTFHIRLPPADSTDTSSPTN